MTAAAHQRAETRTMRVFIVEDAPNMQVAIQDLVCSVADAEIAGVVGSEAGAVDRAREHAGRWDLAIVDLTLEQGDGFKSCAASSRSRGPAWWSCSVPS